MEKLKNFHIQKFDGNNFQLWKFQMEIIFRAEKILDVVDGSTIRPEATEVDRRKAWDEKNSRGMLIISTGLEYSQLQVVVACETAAQMWNRLKSVHEQRSSVNKVTLKQQFFSYKMKPNESIAQHISKIESMAMALADVDERVTDVDKIAKTLESLPSSYGAFINAWDSYDETKQTFENLTSRLLKEEKRITQEDDVATAFAALNVLKKKKNPSQNDKNGDKGKSTDKTGFTCFYCKKVGHMKRDCLKWKAKHKKDNQEDGSKTVALSAELKNISVSGCENAWLADSAASKHMTFHKDWFTVFRPIDSSSNMVQISDNSFVQAEGIGSVEVSALVNGQWEPRTLENTLYVPKLKKNLFSVGAATSKQFKVTFDDSKIEVRNQKVIATGIKMTNQCYKMLFKEKGIEQANAATEESVRLWHERLGHPGINTLKEMASQGLIPGIKTSNIDKFFCDSCQSGKMHRLPFHANLSNRISKPGEFIHSDVCGKMPVTSLGGANYFLLFKDDCTSYRFVYFMKHKSDTFSTFLQFQQMIERQTGNKIKVFKSDNGREFVNEHFTNHFKKTGIIAERTAPYCAEQNGRIERENRSIVECARTMLIDANLPETLWAEAVSTSVYILNRRPSKVHDKVTPFEKFTSKKATLKHMRKFGAEAHVHIPKIARGKFDSKAQKVIFIGYDGYSTNYRLYNHNTRKVTVARDVTFNEGNTSGALVNDPEYTVYSSKEDVQEDVQENDPPDRNVEEEEKDGVEKEKKSQPENKGPTLRDRKTLKAPDRFNACQATIDMACAAIYDEPQTYQEAVADENAKEWKNAMKEEMVSLSKHETWTLTSLPPGRQAIGCKWIYKIKRRPDGRIERFKARLCAKGYSQKQGIDYMETFSPVIRYDSIRILLALATINDMEILQFDIKTAFLYGDLTEDIYMKQPEGFQNKDPDMVCKLRKSLYGLKQSPRCWNKKFCKFLSLFNLQPLESDKCVFRAIINGVEIWLALCVDDGMLMSTCPDTLALVIKELRSQFEIKIDESNYFVGIEINRDKQNKVMCLSQQGYIERVLTKFNMQDCNPQKIPADPSLELQSEDEEVQRIINKPYREAVGSLMFLAVVTRPDIAFAVGQVSRFLNNPSEKHWIAVKRIMRYLAGTKSYGICYRGIHDELMVYSDADFAGDITTRKSTTGYLSMLAGAPVTWSSHRQGCVSRSTTEAEYIAASAAAQEIMWLRMMLKELQVISNEPTNLFIDNQSAIRLVKNSEHHKLTKHIDVKYHYIKECVENQNIVVEYVPSEKQLADFLTKALPRDKFCLNRESVSVINVTEQRVGVLNIMGSVQ